MSRPSIVPIISEIGPHPTHDHSTFYPDRTRTGREIAYYQWSKHFPPIFIMHRTMKGKYLTVSLLLILVSTAGCMQLFPGKPAPQRSEVGLNPAPAVQSGEFNYTGEVSLTGIGDECIEDVTVILYDEDLTKIEQQSVGDLCYGNNSTQPLNLSTSTQPEYIVDRFDDRASESSGLPRFAETTRQQRLSAWSETRTMTSTPNTSLPKRARYGRAEPSQKRSRTRQEPLR